MNTCIRRGSLFALKWKDVGFEEKTVTIEAENIKSSKLTILLMNTVVAKELVRWRRCKIIEFIFASSRTGKMFDDVKKSGQACYKETQIENFRWRGKKAAIKKNFFLITKDNSV